MSVFDIIPRRERTDDRERKKQTNKNKETNKRPGSLQQLSDGVIRKMFPKCYHKSLVGQISQLEQYDRGIQDYKKG